MESWLVGWNPRGLVVVAAGAVVSSSVTEANEVIGAVKRDLEARCAAPLKLIKSLRIIGRLRGSSSAAAAVGGGREARNVEASGGSTGNAEGTASPVSNTDDFINAGARQMRQRSDIWLELRSGPALLELWCCGFRVQPCQLHVLRCDPRVKQFSTIPVAMSVTSRFGVSGVRKLIEGQRPLCVAGAQSALEGVILPEFLLPFVGPWKADTTDRGTQAGCPVAWEKLVGGSVSENGDIVTASFAFDGSSSAPPMQDSEPQDHARLDSATSEESDEASEVCEARQHLRSETDPGKASVGERENMSRLGSRPLSQHAATGSRHGRAPRLDFPVSEHYSELNTLLQIHNIGRLVRDAIELGVGSVAGHARSSSWAEQDVATAATGPCGSHGASDNSHCTEVTSLSGTVECLISFHQRALRVLGPASQVSHVCHLLEFRCREAINWLSMLKGTSHVCGLHPLIPHQVHDSAIHRDYCMLNFVVRVAFDSALGLLLCALLLLGHSTLVPASQRVSRYFLYEIHMGYTEWFEGWPAGLKLHDDLNLVMSFSAKLMLNLWDAAVTYQEHYYNWIATSYTVLAFLAPFGASCALCLIADVCTIVSIHLQLLFRVMALPYRLLGIMLSSLFMQFRGRKYNPLRRRVDACDFGVDQMVMGTLLFTIGVFLYPTVAVYYFYFALVRTSIWLVQELLVAVAFLVVYCPLYSVLFWLTRRRTLSGGVALARPVIRAAQLHATSGSGGRMARNAETYVDLSPGAGAAVSRNNSNDIASAATWTAEGGAVRHGFTAKKEALGSMARPASPTPAAAGGSGSGVGGGSASQLLGKSVSVEVEVQSLPMSLGHLLVDFRVAADILLECVRPRRVLTLICSAEQPHGTNVLQRLVPHIYVDCVSPVCTFCREPDSPTLNGTRKSRGV